MMKRGIFRTLGDIAAVAAFVLLLLERSPLGIPWGEGLRELGVLCFSVLILEAGFRLFCPPKVPRKPGHSRFRWAELTGFFALAFLWADTHATTAGVCVRLIVTLAILLVRGRHHPVVRRILGQAPALLGIVSFLLAICAGAILLTLPAVTVSGAQTGLVDAFFTATSATCVTGLTVLDTATYFNLYGQLLILAMIQVGGLGIMTFSVSMALLLGKRIGIQGCAALQDVLDYDTLEGIRRLILAVVGLTVTIELLGTMVLAFAWSSRCGGFMAALYPAAFHSISAFCNAGFSTFSDNLVQFRADWITNVTICLLIVLGGLGFTVIYDLIGHMESRRNRLSGGGLRLRVQTKVVLLLSFLFVGVGAVLIYQLECRRSFADMQPGEQVLAAVFQSVTLRTAGFNTCDLGALSNATLLLCMAWMFVGASPGSTGGGIKTTTVAVLWAAMFANLKRSEHVAVFRRTLPVELVSKAVTLLCLALGLILFFAVALLHTETQGFRDVMFETVSAFGTVGVSTGLTPKLSVAGRVLVTLLMFIGRLGTLTVAYALAQRGRAPKYMYAEERIMVG